MNIKMFQSYPPSLGLEAAGKRSRWKNKLSDLPDIELVRIIKSVEEEFGDKEIPFLMIADQPDEFYKGAAAVDILRERHGPYYIEEKLSIRQPFLYKSYYKIREGLKKCFKKIVDSIDYVLDFPSR